MIRPEGRDDEPGRDQERHAPRILREKAEQRPRGADRCRQERRRELCVHGRRRRGGCVFAAGRFRAPAAKSQQHRAGQQEFFWHLRIRADGPIGLGDRHLADSDWRIRAHEVRQPRVRAGARSAATAATARRRREHASSNGADFLEAPAPGVGGVCTRSRSGARAGTASSSRPPRPAAAGADVVLWSDELERCDAHPVGPRRIHHLHERSDALPQGDEVWPPAGRQRDDDGRKSVRLREEDMVQREHHLLGVEAELVRELLQRVDRGTIDVGLARLAQDAIVELRPIPARTLLREAGPQSVAEI